MSTTDLARTEPQNALPETTESGSLVNMIERMASDPTVDVTKLERLLDLQERVLDRQARAAFNAALAELQPELPVITERGKIAVRGEVQSTYALWEDINQEITPLLSQHGFSLSFRTGREDGQMVVTGVLSHRDGHSEQTSIHLPADTSGSKNAVQAVGSSTSYGKRYTAMALLNITSRGEDDDGGKAGARAITDEQKQRIIDLIRESESDTKGFCKFLGVAAVDEIPAARFNEAEQALRAKLAAKKRKEAGQ